MQTSLFSRLLVATKWTFNVTLQRYKEHAMPPRDITRYRTILRRLFCACSFLQHLVFLLILFLIHTYVFCRKNLFTNAAEKKMHWQCYILYAFTPYIQGAPFLKNMLKYIKKNNERGPILNFWIGLPLGHTEKKD